jgi:hypothetical protein
VSKSKFEFDCRIVSHFDACHFWWKVVLGVLSVHLASKSAQVHSCAC